MYVTLKELKKDIENNEDTTLCTICRGFCCRHAGCPLSVDDFMRWYGDVTEENIKKALLSDGKIALDWYDGDYRDSLLDENGDYYDYDEKDRAGQCYYFRMRHVGEPPICPSFGGKCVALTPLGCALSWEERPLGGKMLTPNRDPETGEFKCTSYNSKLDFIHDWFPYNDLLEKICDELYPDMHFAYLNEMLDRVSKLP